MITYNSNSRGMILARLTPFHKLLNGDQNTGEAYLILQFSYSEYRCALSTISTRGYLCITIIHFNKPYFKLWVSPLMKHPAFHSLVYMLHCSRPCQVANSRVNLGDSLLSQLVHLLNSFCFSFLWPHVHAVWQCSKGKVIFLTQFLRFAWREPILSPSSNSV